MTAIFKTWTRRVESGRMTHSQCRHWAWTIIPLSRDESPRHRKSALTGHEARGLRELMWDRGGVLLHPEHEDMGYAWIIKNRSAFPFNVREMFDHFSFQGDGARVGRFYVPVWRIHLKDGNTFDYANVSWQTNAAMVGYRPGPRPSPIQFVTPGYAA